MTQDRTFWTTPAIEAYLSGANATDMIILDLYSDVAPVWSRTDSYFGKAWIWCMLHNFGGACCANSVVCISQHCCSVHQAKEECTVTSTGTLHGQLRRAAPTTVQ